MRSLDSLAESPPLEGLKITATVCGHWTWTGAGGTGAAPPPGRRRGSSPSLTRHTPEVESCQSLDIHASLHWLAIGKLGGRRRQAEKPARSTWLDGCPLAWRGKAANPTAPCWALGSGLRAGERGPQRQLARACCAHGRVGLPGRRRRGASSASRMGRCRVLWSRD